MMPYADKLSLYIVLMSVTEHTSNNFIGAAEVFCFSICFCQYICSYFELCSTSLQWNLMVLSTLNYLPEVKHELSCWYQ